MQEADDRLFRRSPNELSKSTGENLSEYDCQRVDALLKRESAWQTQTFAIDERSSPTSELIGIIRSVWQKTSAILGLRQTRS